MVGAVIIGAIIGGLIGLILGIMTAVNNNEKMYMDQYKKGYEDAKRIYRGR